MPRGKSGSSRSGSSRSGSSRSGSSRSSRSGSSRTTSRSKGVKPVAVKNIANLYRHASKRSAVRFGSTVNPVSRASAYKNDGYIGKMYYAQTSNMKWQENKGLKSHSGKHNVQKKSNAAAKPGNVYVIVGQKKQ